MQICGWYLEQLVSSLRVQTRDYLGQRAQKKANEKIVESVSAGG